MDQLHRKIESRAIGFTAAIIAVFMVFAVMLTAITLPGCATVQGQGQGQTEDSLLGDIQTWEFAVNTAAMVLHERGKISDNDYARIDAALDALNSAVNLWGQGQVSREKVQDLLFRLVNLATQMGVI